jgi:adenosylmethionine-8-amino-7-oxononanoate aminotransferase
VEEAILAEGPDTVAAFIAEPIHGGGGVIYPTDDYFPRIREICDHYEVLFIADEVITGFGRLGTFWGLQQWDVAPDIISFAKGITSGYQPLGGTIVSDAIREAIYSQPVDVKFMHAFTYSAHPTLCAVAHANLDIFEREKLVERAASLGPILQERLGELRNDACVKEVRGRGMMAGIELDPKSVSAGAVIARLKERGVFTRHRLDTICLAPPLVIKEDELDELCATVISTVRELARKPH